MCRYPPRYLRLRCPGSSLWGGSGQADKVEVVPADAELVESLEGHARYLGFFHKGDMLGRCAEKRLQLGR